MDDNETFKLPRLYSDHQLSEQGVIELSAGQAHYLHNVLRRQNGDLVRLFDGKNGEWLGSLGNLSKKTGQVTLQKQLVAQPTKKRAIHLLFAPIKKHRQDWLIEKAVELGVTDFHPVLTQNTEVRKLNDSRLTQQIFEAAEQCERFDIPQLHDLKKLDKILSSWSAALPLFACIERFNTKPLQEVVPNHSQNVALLIGPEGGFTEMEKNIIAKHATAVGLGDTILRCETAVIKALVLLNA